MIYKIWQINLTDAEIDAINAAGDHGAAAAMAAHLTEAAAVWEQLTRAPGGAKREAV